MIFIFSLALLFACEGMFSHIVGPIKHSKIHLI